MQSMNNINLIGRITKELELKKTNSGKSVVSFSLAVGKYAKNEGDPEADFIPVVVWNATAENLTKYCRKGSQIGVSGRLTSRKYETTDGQNRTVLEVVADQVQFLDSKQKEAEPIEVQVEAKPKKAKEPDLFHPAPDPVVNYDDLPF